MSSRLVKSPIHFDASRSPRDQKNAGLPRLCLYLRMRDCRKQLPSFGAALEFRSSRTSCWRAALLCRLHLTYQVCKQVKFLCKAFHVLERHPCMCGKTQLQAASHCDQPSYPNTTHISKIMISAVWGLMICLHRYSEPLWKNIPLHPILPQVEPSVTDPSPTMVWTASPNASDWNL